MPLWLLAVLAGLGGGSAYLVATDTTHAKRLPLDAGLTPHERDAITFAYLYERNPSPLRGFAAALRPQSYVAAGLLEDRAARLVTQGVNGMPQTVGNVFDLDNYTDAVSNAASTAVDVVTHPADTASGAWHVITHPSDSISDFADACVDALHAIPGMNEAGDLLKDFARTTFGQWCLRILATVGYYVLAPYLGAQLAAVSFAFPGVAKGDPFLQAWITETIDRILKTINILLQQGALNNLGSATSEAVNDLLAQNPAVQALAKDFTDQIGKATTALENVLGDEIAKAIRDNAPDAMARVAKKLGEVYGIPPDFAAIARDAGNIRQDNAAAAYDLLAGTDYQGSIAWDPYTGVDIAAAKLRSASQASQYAGTTVYQDPKFLPGSALATLAHASAVAILDKPPRTFWTDYYLTRLRFAEARAAAARLGKYLVWAPDAGGPSPNATTHVAPNPGTSPLQDANVAVQSTFGGIAP